MAQRSTILDVLRRSGNGFSTASSSLGFGGDSLARTPKTGPGSELVWENLPHLELQAAPPRGVKSPGLPAEFTLEGGVFFRP